MRRDRVCLSSGQAHTNIVTGINNMGYLRIVLSNILPARRAYIQTIFCHSLIMISTTFYIASRVAITGLISVLFFEETVLHPIRSGPKKVSAGLVVSAVKSTIILILAADEAASIYLSDDTSAPSAEGHIPDAVPAVPRLLGTVCPVCKLHQVLASNHQTSPGSPLPLTFNTSSILEPGLRIKARLASLRYQTNAVAAVIPATTASPTFTTPAMCFLTSPASYARPPRLHY